MKICLFDPAIEDHNGTPSANLGDLIIQEAVLRELKSIFDECEINHIPTHVFPEQRHIALAHSCSFIFAGGTNLLGSNMRTHMQWKLSFRQKLQLRRAILMGVTWERYEGAPTWFTYLSLRVLLSRRYWHSVRDNYAKEKLESVGIHNVINTGCPTMWPLANLQAHDIPTTKSENALVMLTDYSKDPDLDNKLLQLLDSQYLKVFIWPQGRNDRDYILDITSNLNSQFVLLDHSLESLDNFIKSGIPFDYIGTRLHGGIRCLLAKKRSLILAIDHRATEISSDTNLPTSLRSNFDYIISWINKPSVTKINMNEKAINLWKSQFVKKSNIKFSLKPQLRKH